MEKITKEQEGNKMTYAHICKDCNKKGDYPYGTTSISAKTKKAVKNFVCGSCSKLVKNAHEITLK